MSKNDDVLLVDLDVFKTILYPQEKSESRPCLYSLFYEIRGKNEKKLTHRAKYESRCNKLCLI